MAWWHAGMILELAALAEAKKVEEAEGEARAGLELARQLHDYGGRVSGVGLLAAWPDPR